MTIVERVFDELEPGERAEWRDRARTLRNIGAVSREWRGVAQHTRYIEAVFRDADDVRAFGRALSRGALYSQQIYCLTFELDSREDEFNDMAWGSIDWEAEEDPMDISQSRLRELLVAAYTSLYDDLVPDQLDDSHMTAFGSALAILLDQIGSVPRLVFDDLECMMYIDEVDCSHLAIEHVYWRQAVNDDRHALWDDRDEGPCEHASNILSASQVQILNLGFCETGFEVELPSQLRSLVIGRSNDWSVWEESIFSQPMPQLRCLHLAAAVFHGAWHLFFGLQGQLLPSLLELSVVEEELYERANSSLLKHLPPAVQTLRYAIGRPRYASVCGSDTSVLQCIANDLSDRSAAKSLTLLDLTIDADLKQDVDNLDSTCKDRGITLIVT